MASNPEFLREGQAVDDYLYPDRLVLGSDDPSVLDELVALYRPIIDQSFAGCATGRAAVPVVRTSLVTAELSKYASNGFLATKVSFANEIARLCETVGATVDEVTSIMALDGRIGPRFLAAGIGWGGSCFAKDVAALIATGEDHDYPPKILQAAADVNAAQRQLVADHLQVALGVAARRTCGAARVVVQGRHRRPAHPPALAIARDRIDRGAAVSAFDPVVSEVSDVPELAVTCDPYAAAADADAVVVAPTGPNSLSSICAACVRSCAATSYSTDATSLTRSPPDRPGSPTVASRSPRPAVPTTCARTVTPWSGDGRRAGRLLRLRDSSNR